MIANESALQARLVVGLEIHVELATQTKMFTAAPNVAHPRFDEAEPNTLCDPVVLGMPGVLPVMNKAAVEMSILVGLALGCDISRFTKWDRKSYYYPDLPKNYQISQYDQPLCHDGVVQVPVVDADGTQRTKSIRILRAHLEEDAGKLLHEAPGGGMIEGSIVDLNRAGTPLLEIVTQPDFESPEEVVAFCQFLRNTCRSLGVTQGIMQKGHMRFEPNINVHIEKDGRTYKTPIVEIKNLNSFKAVAGSIAYEYQRQIEQWQATGQVMSAGAKSTRGWDDASQQTFLQREKEDAHDYRYFPDPDLVPVVVDDAWLDAIRTRLVEPPHLRCLRYQEKLGLNAKDAQTLTDEPKLSDFFESILALGVEPKRAAVLLLNNLAKRANTQNCRADQLSITAQQIKAVEDLLRANQISSGAADDLLGYCCDDPSANAGELARQKGLLQVSDDSALAAWCDQAIQANPKAVADFKAGKQAALTAMMGAVMKLSKGKANPKIVSTMLLEKLRA